MLILLHLHYFIILKNSLPSGWGLEPPRQGGWFRVQQPSRNPWGADGTWELDVCEWRENVTRKGHQNHPSKIHNLLQRQPRFECHRNSGKTLPKSPGMKQSPFPLTQTGRAHCILTRKWLLWPSEQLLSPVRLHASLPSSRLCLLPNLCLELEFCHFFPALLNYDWQIQVVYI